MVTLDECKSLCVFDRRCTSINHDGNQELPGLCMLNIVSSPEHWSMSLDAFPAFQANLCTRQRKQSGIWCAEGPAVETNPSRRHLHLFKPRICVESSEGILELQGGKHVVRAMAKTKGLPPSSRAYMEVKVTEFEVNTVAGHTDKGFVDGYGTHSQFGKPAGVSVTASNTIFVSDQTYNSIRTIDSLTAASTTIGNVEASLFLPSKLAASVDGRNLFVVDTGGARIQHLELTEGSQNLTSYRTLAGSSQGSVGHQDGNGDQVLFHGIQGITLSEQGAAFVVYVTCSQTHSIRRVDVSSLEVTTLLGSGDANVFGHADGTADQALFDSPWSIVVSSDQQHLYVSELRGSIRKVQLPVVRNGLSIPLMVSTVEVLGQDGSIHSFHGIVEFAMTDLDILWIGDNDNCTLHALSLKSGKIFATYGSGSRAHLDAMQYDSSFIGFSQLAIAQDGSALFAVDGFSPSLRSVFTGRVYTPKSFDPPAGRYFVTSTATRYFFCTCLFVLFLPWTLNFLFDVSITDTLFVLFSSLSIFLWQSSSMRVPSGCRSKDLARPCVLPFLYSGRLYKGFSLLSLVFWRYIILCWYHGFFLLHPCVFVGVGVCVGVGVGVGVGLGLGVGVCVRTCMHVCVWSTAVPLTRLRGSFRVVGSLSCCASLAVELCQNRAPFAEDVLQSGEPTTCCHSTCRFHWILARKMR